eukprot:Tbor_TRINITY_DN2217_c0_g1::TRINITY_DN2217_c0_g1_i1::g.2799::m.2799
MIGVSDQSTTIVILCDECDINNVENALSRHNIKGCAIVPLNSDRGYEDIRRSVCSRRGSSAIFVNWCSGSEHQLCTGRASSAMVSHLLVNVYKVPMVGNRPETLRYDAEDIRALMHYSELPVPPYCFITDPNDTLVSAVGLSYPLVLRPGDVGRMAEGVSVDTAEELDVVARQMLCEHRLLMASVKSGEPTHSYTIVTLGGQCDTDTVETHVSDATPLSDNGTGVISAEDLRSFTDTIVLTIMKKNKFGGSARVFICKGSSGEGFQLSHLSFLTGSCDTGIDLNSYFTTLVPRALADFKANAAKYIVTFAPDKSCYLMRAAMDIKHGACVFEDEGRAFSMVTKGHVTRTWSEKDRIVFSRFAWPLDSDGHLYAIWEEDPKRWRPINHSCDPNLIFDKGHSLNVTASRDIARSEELTMDYATFCDDTMMPFQCECKSHCCRGMIRPDEVSLNKYGTHSWIRRLPPRDGDLAHKEKQ